MVWLGKETGAEAVFVAVFVAVFFFLKTRVRKQVTAIISTNFAFFAVVSYSLRVLDT